MNILKIDTDKIILISYKIKYYYNMNLFLKPILINSLGISNIEEHYIETDRELKLLLQSLNEEGKKRLIIVNLNTVYSEIDSGFLDFNSFVNLFIYNTNNYELFFSNTCMNNHINFSFYITLNCHDIFNHINHELFDYFEYFESIKLRTTIIDFVYGINLYRLRKLNLNNEFVYEELIKYFTIINNDK
ncbi:MAG: hypothetical protein IPH62_19600 [Ignavibacteriae bacterium]|nr:hypothetical protein [Ignavibacteriota bacterium]